MSYDTQIPFVPAPAPVRYIFLGAPEKKGGGILRFLTRNFGSWRKNRPAPEPAAPKTPGAFGSSKCKNYPAGERERNRLAQIERLNPIRLPRWGLTPDTVHALVLLGAI